MKLSPLSMTRSFQTLAGFEGLPPWHPPGARGLCPSLSLQPLGTCLTAWSLRPLRGTNGNYKAFCSKKKKKTQNTPKMCWWCWWYPALSVYSIECHH